MSAAKGLDAGKFSFIDLPGIEDSYYEKEIISYF
jgi:hypothetical protein